MENQETFSLLHDDLIAKLSQMNIKDPTKVQSKVIPLILQKKNVLFQSDTGTGKTFAYLLPLISNLISNSTLPNSTAILICAPTFELASQIKQAASSITNLKCGLFIGGAPIKRQIEALKEKPAIVVGTPSRLLELMNLKKLKLQNLQALVLDEADRLLKKESKDDIIEMFELLPNEIQKIACSATIDNNTRRFFSDTEQLKIEHEDVLKKNIEHWAIYAESRDKIQMLKKFLLAQKPKKALVFTSRADQVQNIFSKLRYEHIQCACLHAKADKKERKAAIDRFRSGKEKILITSDLAARGLDICGVTHIIQMDLPSDSDFFIHRAGRTARAGAKGTNILIGDEYEMRSFSLLEKKLGITVYPKEVREGIVQAPYLE
ncbi:MAG: DEAD/DEAH box helicase [Treponema sp.]|nr:DEAD/DEAH box helicase [Treponema sp.]